MCKYLTFKTKPPDHCNQKFLNLYEYIAIAEKIISYKKIKHTDDLISDIVHAIILADWKYNPHKGSKRNMRFSYATRALKPKLKKPMQFEQINKDKYRDQFNKRQIFELLNWSCISDIERQCLELYYIYNYTLRETGKQLNLKSHAVTKNINKALIKLRKYV